MKKKAAAAGTPTMRRPNPDCTTGSRIAGIEEKGRGLLHALVKN